VDPISDGSSRGRLGGASLLSSVSRTTLAALTVGLALGVAAPREARAGPGTVNPSQTFTYVLGTYNPTTFGVGAGIYAASGAGVYGGSGAAWNVANLGVIQGSDLGVFLKSPGSGVTNAGSISTTTGSYGQGVYLTGGGTLNNKSGGAIIGSGFGGRAVSVIGGAGNVTNAGSISATDTLGFGVFFADGGTVNNKSGGTITGSGGGVYVFSGSTAVTNAGAITATGTAPNGALSSGVFLGDGGTVTNESGGSISGAGIGVSIAGGGTVTNAGAIGGGTASVQFAGAGTNSLTLQTGSTLTGDAIGSTAAGATNALVLQGHGTANNNFVNFNTLSVQASGAWTLGGNSTFGDAMVTSGTLSVTGTLKSSTLEIAAPGQFVDTGAVTVTGAVTNAGGLTINGVTMNVVGVGGKFTQTGGTTTLLNGGVLDPASVNISGGVFGGSGGVVGDVSVTGGEIKAGAAPGGSLTVKGDYSQTGGEIVFDIDPNGVGGFLETMLVLDPSDPISISDTTFVFDFLNYATASQFIGDGLFNLNAFIGLADGGQFCSELNCATVLQDVSFSSDNATISGFDAATGAISARAVPEPGTWALLITGFLGLGGLRRARRTALAD
jgi:hypothetical protein